MPTQTPPSAAQLSQNWPPMPHSLGLVPGRQTLPAQQPGQFWGPHWFWNSQTPPWPSVDRQAPPSAWQSLHCCPPRPHWVCDVPGTHTFPEQHPEQLLALHDGWPSQTPPTVPWATHFPPEPAQFPHTAPLMPHAVGSVPDRHSVPKQQPLHVCAPHGGSTHCCRGEHARLELSQ